MATKEDVRSDLWQEAQDTIAEYGPRDQLLDRLEELYFHPDDYPKAEETAAKDDEVIEIVHMPRASNVIELIQDMMAAAGYNIAVAASDLTPKARKLAEQAEMFCRETLRQSQEQQATDFVGQLAWYVGMRGAGAARVQVRPEWMEEGKPDPEKDPWGMAKRIPIQVQLRDPRNLYPALGRDGLIFIIEKQQRTVRDIRRTYGEHVLEKRQPADMVDWIEYWDAERYQFWADGEAMGAKKGQGRGQGPFPHQYGRNPYVYHFARQTGKAEPEKRMRPILQAMRPVIERADMLDSMEHTFIAHYIGTGWKTVSKDGKLGFDPTPGRVHRLKEGEDIQPIQAGRTPLELEIAQSKLDGHFERGTFPATFYGSDPGRVISGFAISLLHQAGQAKLQPMVSAIERLMRDICVNILAVAEKQVATLVQGKVPFYVMEKSEGQFTQSEKTLDAAGLKGFYPVEVSLGDLVPQDRITEMQLAMQERQEGPHGMPLLSDATILESHKIAESPELERKKILLQQVRSSPELVGLEAQLLIAKEREALREELNGLDVDVFAAENQIRMGQPLTAPQQVLEAPPGGPPPPYIPPAPGVAAPIGGVAPEVMPPEMLGAQPGPPQPQQVPPPPPFPVLEDLE